jgi:hypothetical protein
MHFPAAVFSEAQDGIQGLEHRSPFGVRRSNGFGVRGSEFPAKSATLNSEFFILNSEFYLL